MDKLKNFIEKAKLCHKGEDLDYSKVIYINNRTPVCIIDKEYGEFWQTPSNHLKGQSHPKRKGLKISDKKRSKTEEIINRFQNVHEGENLNYSKVDYVNMHTKVCIIDPIYGEYYQEPIVHLKGCGHPLRGNRKTSDKNRMTTEEFITKSKLVHEEDKYTYEKSIYNGYKEPICINCHKKNKKGEEHGYFWITPDNFLQGKGCQKCGNQLSIAECELREFFEKKNIDIIKNDRKILEGDELDIFIPSINIGIEYNGLRWHSELFKDKNYHLNKLEKCIKKGIKLIQIFEDEYIEHKEIVYGKISHLIKENKELKKIDGRKCEIKEISKNESKIFLDKNHIQGYVSSSVYLGSFYNGRLIAVMQFKKEKENKWELTRFASDNYCLCRGVGGKLFKHFITNYNPSEIKSFADRRWTIDEKNNIYAQLGFKFEKYTGPEYRYIVGGKRLHKFGFRKQILHKKYNLPLTMTENEMTKELGFDRIWDCGLIKYVWKKETDE